MNANYTLLDILTNNVFVYRDGDKEHLSIENGIEIPMIQRDYAQGRNDKKTEYIRTKFLNDIYEVLESNQKGEKKVLNLDFVYGYIENNTFIPLDGQQRLTTLYIIYWYLGFKDDIDFSQYGLNLFSYKTRQSTKEFLKSINNLDNQLKIKEDCNNDFKKLTCTIKNQPWYNLKWDYDPTVKGFMQTLQDVVLLFSDISFSTLKDDKPLCFHFLKIDEYGLGDNLYIKMNARGKALSDFEKFKASFENIISKNGVTSEYFIKKIDGEWLDSFWEYSLNSLPDVQVEENVERLTQKCDFLLLEFIKKVTEYLFFKDNIGKTYEFTDSNLEKIYSSEKNLTILNNFFDLISKQDFTYWVTYFDEIFSERWVENKVSTNQSSMNFILKIFNSDAFSHFENLLFFGWITNVLKNESIEITDDLKDFLRIIRNYINNINQKNKTSLDTELRTDYYSDILNVIENVPISNPYSNLDVNKILFRKEYLQFELDKYNLFKEDKNIKDLVFKFEDHSTLRGLIFNFDFTPYKSNEIRNIVDNFYNLFKYSDLEKDGYFYNIKNIISLFLSYGEYSVKVGNSNLGDFKFFGQRGKWHRVLASPDGEIRSIFNELFKVFSMNQIDDWNQFIEKIVSENIEKYRDSWIWYCLNPKYRFILDYSIYTINHEKRVEIFYNQSLNSYHYNPFVFWFRFHSPDNIRKHINEPYSCAQYTSFSKLYLKNGIQLEQIENTWHIFGLEKNFVNERYEYNEQNESFIFKCQNLIDDLMSELELLNNSKSILK